MPTLQNDQLRVDLLDPRNDRSRLGTRYGWAGYIWQVHDRDTGPLLAGPEWPNPNPDVFNGQGLPESFRHRSREGKPFTWRDDRGIAIGVGELAGGPDGRVALLQPCEWSLSHRGEQYSAETRQAAAGFSYAVSRTVELAGRTLLSRSTLTNHGENALQLEWFAHPFFALRQGKAEMRLQEGCSLAENPGFAIAGGRLVQKRVFRDARDGHMDRLLLPENHPLQVSLRHPKLAWIHFETSFVPSECIIWGNSNTFSVEPYQRIALAPGESRTWSLRYEFGPAGFPG